MSKGTLPYVPNNPLVRPHIIRPNRFYSAFGQQDLETVGNTYFSDSFRLRADIRQLSERVYLPHAARVICGAAGIRLSSLREGNPVLRQYSRIQLADPGRTLSQLFRAHYSALSDS
jgi:hypothetical protein